jgi:excisionase family DNA binding protein
MEDGTTMASTNPEMNRIPGLARIARADASSLPQRIEEIRRAMTATEVAELLAVSPITVYKMAKAGRLPSFRIGTSVRFDPRAVAEWLRANAA